MNLKHGGYRLTVRTDVCGASNLGSIPSNHPKINEKVWLNPTV